jgi:hypothetical protein
MLVFASLLASCRTHPADAPAPVSSNLLTAADLVDAPDASAYAAVERLRPFFLQSRGRTSILLPNGMGPAVWVDGTLMGGVEVLQSLRPDDIASIRRVEAWDAATTYGPDFPDGVLIVTTRR